MIRTTSRAPTAAPSATLLSLGAWLGRRLFPGPRSAPLIDPDALSDALRHDLGFMDGRHAGRRDPRWD